MRSSRATPSSQPMSLEGPDQLGERHQASHLPANIMPMPQEVEASMKRPRSIGEPLAMRGQVTLGREMTNEIITFERGNEVREGSEPGTAVWIDKGYMAQGAMDFHDVDDGTVSGGKGS